MNAWKTSIILIGLAAAAAAQPLIDGINIPAQFPASIATQDTNTQFGDNENELNRMFVTGDASNVYIGLTGNIGDNNAVTVFIDTTPGNNPAGQTLSTDPGGPCPGPVPTVLRMLSGTHMDAGFDPDYCLLISVGKFPGQSDSQLVYAADLTNLLTLANRSLGIGAVSSTPGNPGPLHGGVLTGNSGVRIAIDNRNDAGLAAWCFDEDDPGDPNDFVCDERFADPTAAAAVTTGIEIAIPRALLGLSAGPRSISFMSFLTNNAQGGGSGPCFREGFASNQVLPGIGGNGNLAAFSPMGSFQIDFTGPQGPGTQFVTTTVP